MLLSRRDCQGQKEEGDLVEEGEHSGSSLLWVLRQIGSTEAMTS